MADWKAVRPKLGAPLELYDLGKDLGEEKNIADRHADVIARIETFLQTARTDSPNWPLKAEGKKKGKDK
jgi:arylsulfatase A